MSTGDVDATTLLKRDFQSYLKGKEPSPCELACAPLIENWKTRVVRQIPDLGPPGLTLVLIGRVTGHPRIADAQMMHTSQLIWLDRNRNWARTLNRVYRLGSTSDE